MSGTSLQAFLKDLQKNAPIDFDPEQDDGFGLPGESHGLVPEHYADVGSSKLRTSAVGSDLAEIYPGQRTSRKDLYANDHAGESDDNSADQDKDDQEEADLPFGPVESDSDSDNGLGHSKSASNSETSDHPDTAFKDEALSRPLSPSAKRKRPENQSMASQLKQAATADVRKGHDIKKQLAFWNSALEMRIKLQPALDAANLLSVENDLASDPEGDSQRSATVSRLFSLSEAFAQLREEMMKRNLGVDPPARKKRKVQQETAIDDVPIALVNSIEALKSMETAYEPTLSATIIKWSDKVSAANTTALKSSNKFNSGKNSAVFKNTWQQIQHAMLHDKQKLIERTRTSRSAAIDLQSHASDIYDDGDFYQQLLKEAADNQILDLDDPAMSALRAAAVDRNKVKKMVDTKASKGRKLRFQVHEKLQNFMVPIQSQKWEESQIDELFNSLLGKRIVSSKNVERDGGDEETAANSGFTDGFRLI